FIPPFEEPPADLMPAGMFNPGTILVGPGADVGAMGDNIDLDITLRGRKGRAAVDIPGRINVGFACVGEGSQELTGFVVVSDPDCAPCKATLTYKFRLTWDPGSPALQSGTPGKRLWHAPSAVAASTGRAREKCASNYGRTSIHVRATTS